MFSSPNQLDSLLRDCSSDLCPLFPHIDDNVLDDNYLPDEDDDVFHDGKSSATNTLPDTATSEAILVSQNVHQSASTDMKLSLQGPLCELSASKFTDEDWLWTGDSPCSAFKTDDWYFKSQRGSVESYKSADAVEEATPYGDIDPSVLKAWNESQGTGSLGPILREELRLKIMKKRLDSGQEEIIMPSVSEPVQHEMTAEEKDKQNKRRQQNREAAQRFRQKKKRSETEMKKKLQENEGEKERLQVEIALLQQEVIRLQSILRHHERVCLFQVSRR